MQWGGLLQYLAHLEVSHGEGVWEGGWEGGLRVLTWSNYTLGHFV